jgi:hypothetical protein
MGGLSDFPPSLSDEPVPLRPPQSSIANHQSNALAPSIPNHPSRRPRLPPRGGKDERNYSIHLPLGSPAQLGAAASIVTRKSSIVNAHLPADASPVRVRPEYGGVVRWERPGRGGGLSFRAEWQRSRATKRSQGPRRAISPRFDVACTCAPGSGPEGLKPDREFLDAPNGTASSPPDFSAPAFGLRSK